MSGNVKSSEEQENEMTSAWRVISFFVVVFILPTLLISIPLYARYHLYREQRLSFTDGDMKSFHGDVSSFWCRGQRVTSNGTFHAYLTSEVKRVRKVRRISRLSSDLLLTYDAVEEWGIHLIRGSTFTFSACSRWPGGTLLVVQGDENMRKCFYKEEKTLEEITGVERKAQKRVTIPAENQNALHKETERKEAEGGGEVFEGDEQLTDKDIIQQLYSSNRNEVKVLSPGSDLSEAELTLHSTTPAPEQETLEIKAKHKNNKKGKKKKKRRKDKRLEDGDYDEKIAKTRAKKSNQLPPQISLSSMRMSNASTNNGLLFFNLNDTLDVTTGNSSFSSSEEFLRQCSNTIISVDLSPYSNCSRMASIDSLNDTMTWKFRANKTDNYYFIFTSDNSIEANIISFRLLLERRLYDVSEHLDMCANKTECVFPFSFLKSEGVIVDFKEHYENISKLENLNNYELMTVCQPRSLVYTVFILLVPFVIIMFAFR